MGLLAKATSGPRPLPRAILCYGTRGIGKSSWASCADSPLVLDIETGSTDIDFKARLTPRDGLDSYAAVMAALDELLNDEHDHKTLVIDTLDWLEQWIWETVCQQHNVKNIEDIGYHKGYLFAVNLWRDLLAALDALRADRGMTVILVAHSNVKRFEAPDSDAYDRYEPKLHKHASAVVQDWCSEVLFATYRTFVTSEDMGFNRKRGVGVGTGERILRTTERPSHMAKNRLGLPDEIPLDWAVFEAACAEHLATTD